MAVTELSREDHASPAEMKAKGLFREMFDFIESEKDGFFAAFPPQHHSPWHDEVHARFLKEAGIEDPDKAILEIGAVPSEPVILREFGSLALTRIVEDPREGLTIYQLLPVAEINP